MRIERVIARAFGPFRGEELELAPGMTVVSGPNEAGKSSWHAALRLAITGIRRGKGPGTTAERQLAERHRPWDLQDRWEVEARLRLADGRTIDIAQDLAGKVDCRAVDVALGRDVSHEILDGTPDASRWLGLSREAFASTISVSQAQILAVAEAADELQEQMQRAAASHASDATAAEAIARLEQYRRDAVGADRVGARGPLRTAKERLVQAEGRLAEARRQHEEFLLRSAEAEATERRLDAARRRVLEAEAVLAAARAAEARRRHAAAAELSERHPAAPEALVARDERADAVAGAIDAWTTRPEPVTLSGQSAADLERQLAELPEAPTGDALPHADVAEALHVLDKADGALAALEADPEAPGDPLPEVEEARVRELARRLRQPQLPQAAALEEELAAARRASAAIPSAPTAVMVGAGLAAIATAVLFALGSIVPAGVAAALAVAAAIWSWSRGATARAASARLARAEAALAPYRDAEAAAERDRTLAAADARDAGLPEDAASLDELADRLAARAALRVAATDRLRQREVLRARRDAAGRALLEALAGRGELVSNDPRGAWSSYLAACSRRAEQAAEAARREPLVHELEARRAAERAMAAAASASASAEARLRVAAASIEIAADAPPDELVDRLRAWQRRRGDELRHREVAIAEWERLVSLLGGRTLADLEADAVEAERRATELARSLGQAPAVPSVDVGELEADLAAHRRGLVEVASVADALRGNLDARREQLPDVAEAEESVLAAEAELRRVEDLAVTLDRTLELLRSAEERVHRSLAPVLADAMRRWLPTVCAGAYVEVSVDPASLSITVKEAATGQWRAARLLSEGTREQIYLLLRVAMAQHLVTNGETAPLLLDEVTVQSDADRKRQLLGVLHHLSEERQVVLFTHDDDVVEWAAGALDPARDVLVRLPARPARAASSQAALPIEDRPAVVAVD